MPLHAFRAMCAFVGVFTLAGGSSAQERWSPSGWAITATLPGTPEQQEVRTPSPFGDEVAQRCSIESATEKFVLTRITYPVFPLSTQRGELYTQAIEAFMNSRAGEIREDAPFTAGEHLGQRLLIEHRRDKTHREVRLLLAGGSLYFVSAEWPGGKTPSAAAAQFLDSVNIAPEFANLLAAETRERWRALTLGNFTVRYDASRWYREPSGSAAGADSILLLRVDQMAEAEFAADAQLSAKSMEDVVIAAARETAERVAVRKRGKRLQGHRSVEELRFTVRADGENYENHGYFYNGPEGSVQLRAWSPEKTFAQVEGDIAELLDGLSVRTASDAPAGR